jgi:hypothetical protein
MWAGFRDMRVRNQTNAQSQPHCVMEA